MSLGGEEKGRCTKLLWNVERCKGDIFLDSLCHHFYNSKSTCMRMLDSASFNIKFMIKKLKLGTEKVNIQRQHLCNYTEVLVNSK